MAAVIEQFEIKVQECLARARKQYRVALKLNPTRYDIRGRIAGQVQYIESDNSFNLRFNPEAIRVNCQDMTVNTIPHEVAHMVAHELYGYFSHDELWKKICRELGGDDARCHDYVLSYVPKPKTKYLYDVDGVQIRVGPAVHKRIQDRSRTYTCSKTGARISPNMWVGTDEPDRNSGQANIIQKANGAVKSKRAAAAEIWNQYKHLPRKDVIAKFVAEVNMTPAGASTYYQNFKTGIY